MWLHRFCDSVTGKNKEAWNNGKIAGTVVLLTDHALGSDRLHEQLPLSFQLISYTHADPTTGKGKMGEAANLEWVNRMTRAAGESEFKIHFKWDDSQGIPGAVIVKISNNHPEFFLKTLTLEGVPGKGKVHFVCNSWINPKYRHDRVFFTNETYLPSKMPAPLRPYRDQEFTNLRGDDVSGPLQEHDRIYRYAVYNDLGDDRPVLGGPEHPYPRRGHTGRPPIEDNPEYESREGLLNSIHIYVPRDERLGNQKLDDFLKFAFKTVGESLIPGFDIFDTTPNEFDSLEDTFNLYDRSTPLPHSQKPEHQHKEIPFKFIKKMFQTVGAHSFRHPIPLVVKEDENAWRTDEEFGREMLAGVNPVIIRLLQEFPPTSKLDPRVFGNQRSTIKEVDIDKNLPEGFTVHKALKENRLFILDHHDAFMPYLPRINKLPGNYVYATRTILFLKDDGTLKPLAIELSRPLNPDELEFEAVSNVYTPASEGVDGSIWQLAKAYAVVNDSGYHQLISHWLNTHAVIEPFIIATHRQLSVTHPIHKLMSPHYRDTMNINALARQTLVNSGGIFEKTVFPRKYALRMSSDVYKSWKLTEQGLPDDLIKRGVAVADPSSPHKLRLLIKDYPYAVDGLEVWSAIESWVNEYCSLYYNDSAVKSDTELQAWWKEIREVGHGDKKDEDWWPKMHTVKELTKTCTTIIWIASALHAAVNYGQYPYAGYLPNRPTVSRRPMPEPGTKAYKELENNPDKVFLETITNEFQTILGISLLEVLSQHSSDEVYLGQRDTQEWTSDAEALLAFGRFRERLIKIEEKIKRLNEEDSGLKNRNGPVKFPYTLLYPNTSDDNHTGGLVPKGIPNSVAI